MTGGVSQGLGQLSVSSKSALLFSPVAANSLVRTDHASEALAGSCSARRDGKLYRIGRRPAILLPGKLARKLHGCNEARGDRRLQTHF